MTSSIHRFVPDISNISFISQESYTPERFKKCLADPKYKFPPIPIVMDDLDLSNTHLPSLPLGLHVKGYLDVSNTDLTSLPRGLYVKKSLFLSNCTQLTSFTPGLYVGQNLFLDGCTGMSSLSPILYVGGDLICNACTNLTSLPAWVMQLGMRSDQLTRRIELVDTGLSQELMDELMQTEISGMKFYFTKGP